MVMKALIILVAVVFATASHSSEPMQDVGSLTRLFNKRSSLEFMGMQVSYPQYVRLRAMQREVIRMDQTIRHMVRTYDPMELAKNQYWMELLQLYDAMKKMLPREYLEAVGNKNPIPI